MWQIIGSGAIGCLWAANLIQTGHQVHLVSRTNNTSEVLTYQDLQHKKHLLECSQSTQLINNSSPILVCVKAPQVKAALLQHRHNISEKQALILMHNGMGCAEQVAELFPNNPIICATTANASLLNSPFNIRQTGLGITYLGAFNHQANAYSHLQIDLNEALGNCHWSDEIEQKLWLKLLINITINPLTAIFQVYNGELSKPHFQQQIIQMIDEMMPVLCKQQLTINKQELLAIINTVINATATNYSSMNRDIFFGRLTENEFINGYLIKKASQYNIETPLITSLFEQVRDLENHSPAPLNTA